MGANGGPEGVKGTVGPRRDLKGVEGGHEGSKEDLRDREPGVAKGVK